MSPHINHATKQEYQGGNVVELEAFRVQRSFESREWMTYRQALSVGRQVRKGEHGCRIVKVVEVEEREDGKHHATKKARHYTVFNLEQTDLIEDVTRPHRRH